MTRLSPLFIYVFNYLVTFFCYDSADLKLKQIRWGLRNARWLQYQARVSERTIQVLESVVTLRPKIETTSWLITYNTYLPHTQLHYTLLSRYLCTHTHTHTQKLLSHIPKLYYGFTDSVINTWSQQKPQLLMEEFDLRGERSRSFQYLWAQMWKWIWHLKHHWHSRPMYRWLGRWWYRLVRIGTRHRIRLGWLLQLLLQGLGVWCPLVQLRCKNNHMLKRCF